ncbi:uncharacterized protein LOC127256913 [Andrographis paniculata]|uniref:uncharacterized protein LOC127256913 n=1 Tax=Andrographis paniculata TaxID=175694 RepID=UPI0021E94E9B|nr:uncharacterized protein LOC127256913 [Andrographis paniculata]
MSKRSIAYSDEKDKLLCEIFSEHTQDAITGRGQSKEAFWKRIVETFNDQNKKDSQSEVAYSHTLKSLESRFSLIQNHCRLFLSCIKYTEDLKKSRASEIDTMMMARDMFKKHPSGSKRGFQFDHVFEIMSNLEKFKDHNEPRNLHKSSRQNFAGHMSLSQENATFESPKLLAFTMNLSDENVEGESFRFNDKFGDSSHL